MNQENESLRQDLYMRIGTMKDSKTKDEESNVSHTLGCATPSVIHT